MNRYWSVKPGRGGPLHLDQINWISGHELSDYDAEVLGYEPTGKAAHVYYAIVDVSYDFVSTMDDVVNLLPLMSLIDYRYFLTPEAKEGVGKGTALTCIRTMVKAIGRLVEGPFDRAGNAALNDILEAAVWKP